MLQKESIQNNAINIHVTIMHSQRKSKKRYAAKKYNKLNQRYILETLNKSSAVLSVPKQHK